MKKLYIILTVFCFISCSKIDVEQGIVLNNKKLQNFLLNYYDENKDGIVSKEEALAVTVISLSNSQEPIDGLENFPI